MQKFVVAFSLLVLIPLLGCSGSAPPTPTPAAQTKRPEINTVNAEGVVVPAPRVSLAFKSAGRVAEILARQGEAYTAGAVLARLDDAAVKAQVAQAQAALAVAQKQLAQLKAGATAADRSSAKQALDSARANLAKVKAGPTAEQLAQLKANLDNARAAVAQAQFRYDRIGGASNPLSGAAPEALAVEQAHNSLRAAEAAYREAASHPTESEIKAAESAVAQAASAVARLDPTPESVALAEAQVAQAQAALDAAKTALQDTLLTAPFDGTVALLDLDPGQVVSPGAPVISFGNLQNLRVETKDLVEVDVARVAVGQPARIKIDAFPDQLFDGRVLDIAPIANEHRGDQVFKATIELPESARGGLRWGMTANVEIIIK